MNMLHESSNYVDRNDPRVNFAGMFASIINVLGIEGDPSCAAVNMSLIYPQISETQQAKLAKAADMMRTSYKLLLDPKHFTEEQADGFDKLVSLSFQSAQVLVDCQCPHCCEAMMTALRTLIERLEARIEVNKVAQELFPRP